LSPPANAVSATIDLLYQGTSWEYIQFLQLANTGVNPFLGNQGDAMMDAWFNADVVQSTGAPITGVQMINGDYKMVPPVIMASAQWGTPPVCNPTEDTEVSCQDGVDNDCDGFIDSSDPDCDIPPVCIPTEDPEATCDDGIDNDCDGAIDCSDSDCSQDPACQTSCSGIQDKGSCNNAPGCVWEGSPKNGTCVDAVACVITENPETSCTDGIDNDCDGTTDCADASCSTDPACQTPTTCNNDGVCDAGEDCLSCAGDCAGVTGGKPANRYCCGNGIQEGPEGDGAVCDGNY
ncbi:MAG: hypothetical protein PVG72_14435, partial [Gammaproteobacteria bacterium]